MKRSFATETNWLSLWPIQLVNPSPSTHHVIIITHHNFMAPLALDFSAAAGLLLQLNVYN
jgi:hypothetical protein